MFPRCQLNLETATDADWREYIATLADDELWPAYEKASAGSHKFGAFAAQFITIRVELRDAMATRYKRVLAERDYAIGELGKAKAQQRIQTLDQYHS